VPCFVNLATVLMGARGVEAKKPKNAQKMSLGTTLSHINNATDDAPVMLPNRTHSVLTLAIFCATTRDEEAGAKGLGSRWREGGGLRTRKCLVQLSPKTATVRRQRVGSVSRLRFVQSNQRINAVVNGW
jgi:hypothetical protein